MKYSPDEQTLISYIYGELEGKELEKVERYFQENPEKLKELHQLNGVRDIMSSIGDKEVIAPPLFMDDDRKVQPLWRSVFFRNTIGIAASFLLLIVAGKMLGTEVSYGNGQLTISFAGKHDSTDKPVSSGLSAAEVQQMIDASAKQNASAFDSKLAENRAELDATVRKSLAANSKQINALAQQASLASQGQIRTFVATMRDENIQSMKEFLSLSAVEQKKYTENLLVDFSKWLQEQRNQDLALFQTRMSTIEENTDAFKQETEQILASIISSAPEQNLKNSY